MMKDVLMAGLDIAKDSGRQIPGVGPLLASAFVAIVTDPTVFKSGRRLAAWIGRVPGKTPATAKNA